ncbi:toxin HicA [Elstera cyanobacteriorum]|uniref:Toxin HicA n=1 Tax=Elstera cyanobacteriorum TaxID=2022747 RepID=A0A255XJL7_9PROT|nr:toxin HicA [Elstera cyanobacteriorum]MCK6442751.1 hypothetical protein [Elstera cyanobacteriorum]OYQ16635.1 toxin HicA [Elstera cyanobacteriorum]GFZ87381.1 hypothetical protein GCM10011497_15490 [Elstera cyanobacteriorum]
MSKAIHALVSQMRHTPQAIRYEDVKKVCEYYFGAPRQNGTAHCVFKMPWQGDPRVNIQRGKDGKAKAYQVKQVLAALERLLAQSKEPDHGG